MRIYEYQELAMRTCSIPQEKAFDRLVHSCCGYISEFVEFVEATRDENGTEEHTKKELGDCFWMLAEMCSSIYWFDFANLVVDCKIYPYVEPQEFAELIQKHYQGHEITENKLYCLVAGSMHLLIDYAESKEYALVCILELNIEKLKARYPEGFEAERSLNRAEGDI